MHYTTRSKAEPEFLVVKRREHARTVWVGASARGHAHEQPQQLRYNWLPAALFFPTVIKVRSSFQPAESRRQEGEDREAVVYSSPCFMCAATSNWTLHTYLEAQERATSVTTSLRFVHSLPLFSYRLPRLKTISRFYLWLCNSCVCHRKDMKNKNVNPLQVQIDVFALFLIFSTLMPIDFLTPAQPKSQQQITRWDNVHILCGCIVWQMAVAWVAWACVSLGIDERPPKEEKKKIKMSLGVLNRYSPRCRSCCSLLKKADDEKRRE